MSRWRVQDASASPRDKLLAFRSLHLSSQQPAASRHVARPVGVYIMAKLIPPKGNSTIRQFFKKVTPTSGEKRSLDEDITQLPPSKRVTKVASINGEVPARYGTCHQAVIQLVATQVADFTSMHASILTTCSVATTNDSPADAPVALKTPIAPESLSVDVEALKPFAHQAIYYCPYRSKGLPCSHRKKGKLQAGEFGSLDGLLQHTDKVHDGGKLVLTNYAESPFEDGTRKVPCPKKCGRLFRTHQQANHHSKIPAKSADSEEKGCTLPNRTNIECIWKRVLVCNSNPATDAKGFANHHSTHVHDPRGLYSCRKDCGQYHVCLYMLQSHEEDCVGPKVPKRETTMRFSLGSTLPNAPDTPAEVVIVGRSSAFPPKAWAMGTSSHHEGLPIWGDCVLRHFAAYTGAKFSNAVLHASSHTRTRFMPAPTVDNSTAQATEDLRWHVRRAFFFTKSILHDIKNANAAGITPTLLSVGLDGFTCNTRALQTWLHEQGTITFDIVFRLKALDYGMTRDDVVEHGSVYWASCSSDALRSALNGGISDSTLARILASMDKLQGIKDALTGHNALKNGRNSVASDIIYPHWQ